MNSDKPDYAQIEREAELNRQVARKTKIAEENYLDAEINKLFPHDQKLAPSTSIQASLIICKQITFIMDNLACRLN